MMLTTDPVYAGYLADLRGALELLRTDDTPDAAALREEIRLAMADINSTWITRTTEYVIELARTLLRDRGARRLTGPSLARWAPKAS